MTEDSDFLRCAKYHSYLRSQLIKNKPDKLTFKKEIEAAHLHGQGKAYEMVLKLIQERADDVTFNDIVAEIHLILTPALNVLSKDYFGYGTYKLEDVLQHHGHYKKDIYECDLRIADQEKIKATLDNILNTLEDDASELNKEIAYNEFKERIRPLYLSKKDYETAIRIAAKELNI